MVVENGLWLARNGHDNIKSDIRTLHIKYINTSKIWRKKQCLQMFIERITNIDIAQRKRDLQIFLVPRGKKPLTTVGETTGNSLPPPSFWWRCGYWTTAMLKVLLSLRERPPLLPHGLRSLADGCTALTELQAGLTRRRGSALSSLAELDAASRYARRGVGTRIVNTPAASFLPTCTRFISSP